MYLRGVIYSNRVILISTKTVFSTYAALHCLNIFSLPVINSQFGSLITLLTCLFPLELCFIKMNSYIWGKKEYIQTLDLYLL